MGDIFVAGFFTGALFVLIAVNVGYDMTDVDVINQCEASLPRDQHCKLVAIVEERAQ